MLPILFIIPAIPDEAICLVSGMTKIKYWYLTLVSIIYHSIEIGLFLYNIDNYKQKLEELIKDIDIIDTQKTDEESREFSGFYLFFACIVHTNYFPSALSDLFLVKMIFLLLD